MAIEQEHGLGGHQGLDIFSGLNNGALVLSWATTASLVLMLSMRPTRFLDYAALCYGASSFFTLTSLGAMPSSNVPL
jgi:hypothetical protein